MSLKDHSSPSNIKGRRQYVSPNLDGLVDEDVGLPYLLDVFRVLEENILLAHREGRKGKGVRVSGQLGEVPLVVVPGHLFQRRVVEHQTIVLPVHPAC